jgi:hypothetical protein
MNSLTKTHSDNDCDPCEKECKPSKVMLKCGNPSSATITVPTTGTAVGTPVTSLTVNTSHFCNPCLKLEFTSNISTATTAVILTATLTFQVFKQCVNQFQPIAIGPQFTFSRTAAAAALLSTTDTFTFFICDCDNCFNDCCTYTVIATPTVAVAGGGTITVANATLAAIIIDNTNQCC